MRVKCLSVRNPLSYLICVGIKDVENRSRKTKHRGTLYIHSSGEYKYGGLVDLSDLPMPVYNESFQVLNDKGEFVKEGNYLKYNKENNTLYLHDGKYRPERIRREFGLMADIFEKIREDPNGIYFHNRAIIGKVDIVDVVQDSDSPWAAVDSYHWILDNAVLFKEPVPNVKGKLGFWYYDVPENLEPAELVK